MTMTMTMDDVLLVPSPLRERYRHRRRGHLIGRECRVVTRTLNL